MIKLIVFDFDGVFTNGNIIIQSNKEIIKSYNVKDGLGIKKLISKNINFCVISGYKENNSQRNILTHLNFKEENIHLQVPDKLKFLIEKTDKLNIDIQNEVAYIGDDINDLEVIRNVFLSACPFDAVDEVKESVTMVLNKKGGEGCVREYIDYIIANNENGISYKNIYKNIYNKNHKTKLLDCTLRDSGYCNNWNWSMDMVLMFTEYLEKSGIEYCEIGFIRANSENKNFGPWYNLTDNLHLIHQIKEKSNIKIAVMLDIKNKEDNYLDTKLIPEKQISRIDLIRIFSFYTVIDKSIQKCKELKKLGYKISLNIGHCGHLDDSELMNIINLVNDNINSIDMLYFADSLAMMFPDDIDNFIDKVKRKTSIHLGFHNHDNNGIVFSNIDRLIHKQIYMIDATLGGFGKNGGNANLEQTFFYLSITRKYEHLNIEYFLKMLDKLSDFEFGLDYDYNNVKDMLRTFMKVHSSHLKNVNNYTFTKLYNYLKELQSKNKIKKIW